MKVKFRMIVTRTMTGEESDIIDKILRARLHSISRFDDDDMLKERKVLEAWLCE